MELIPRQRKAPWIGAGKSGSWDSVTDALRECGLNFHVKSLKPSIEIDERLPITEVSYIEKKDVPNTWANVRTDSNEIIGVVSDKYNIVQNKIAFSLMQPVLDAGGEITAGGMTEQGLCFMVAQCEKFMTEAGELQMNVMVTNSFNGKYPLSVILSPTRIICQNMYRGLTKNKDNVLRIMHSITALDRVEEAKSVMSVMNDEILRTLERIKIANGKAMGNVDLKHYLKMAFPMPKVSEEIAQITREKIEEQRERFLDIYYDASDNVAFHGRCLGFLNAYYDYMSHDIPNRRYSDWEGRRLGKIVDGSSVRFNLINALTH